MNLIRILNELKKHYSGEIRREIDTAIIETQYGEPISGDHMPAILHFIEMNCSEPSVVKEIREVRSRGEEYQIQI